MRMNQPARFVSSPEKEVTAWHTLEKVRHIFTAHGSHRFVANHIVNTNDICRALRDQLAHLWIIYQGRCLSNVLQPVGCSHRFAYTAHYSLEHFRYQSVSLFVEGSHSPAQGRSSRNDVESGTGVKGSDCHHSRIERRDIATDHRLECGNNLRCGDDGIDRLMRHRAVTADAFDRKLKLIDGRHQCTVVNADGSDWHIVPDVQSNCGSD